MTAAFAPGHVVLAACVDPRGNKPKVRPLLVVGVGAGTLHCVAITSQVQTPLPAAHVPLAHANAGGCRTGLTVRSVAACDWPVDVDPGTARRIGVASGRELARVDAALRLLAQTKAADAGQGGTT